MANTNLHKAKKQKNDEFYTQLVDIENELRHYQQLFRGKVVYCNCDDPKVSNFFRYFFLNFAFLGLKKLITTCYKNQDAELFSQHRSERAVGLICAEREREREKNSDPCEPDIEVFELQGNGDFRSQECIELLKEADIVVTNPPFSLFRRYVAQLIEYRKRFLIIGNKSAITYKEIFPFIRDNRIWPGVTSFSGGLWFDTPTGKRNVSAIWFTNLDHAKRHEDLILYRHLSSENYPHYDNYDAINVDKTADIPQDWAGVMGVPITFLDKYNPEQFEILGTSDNGIVNDEIKTTPGLRKKFVDDYYMSGGTGSYREGNPTAGYYKNGVAKMAYKRIFIRRRPTP